MQSDRDLESRWELLPAGCFVALVPGGLRLGLGRRGLESRFVPFAELTHVESTSFGVWIATRKTTLLIRRAHFVREGDPESFVQAVRWQLADEPDGREHLERMRRVAERALAPHPRRATYTLMALCVAVFVLELADPFTLQAGVFVPVLVNVGEWWRIVTANLLHEPSLLLPFHIVLNMVCLAAFGLLVERPLGAVRTFLVMAAGGVGGMLGSAIAGYQQVLGASAVVAGLVGAVLWLEFNEAERLPAWWRIPRRFFLWMLVLQGVLDAVLPFVAAAAHLGGLAAGYLIMPLAAEGALDGRPLTRMQRYAAIAVAVAVLASMSSAFRLIERDPSALASHGRHLLEVKEVGPYGLNDLAWRMVTESKPDAEELDVATALAERAVERTDRRDPNILDTLAEVLFVAGDDQGAVAVIDEAIQLAQGETYFREQRRRFTGERAAGDRPDPPSHWIVPAPDPDHVIPMQDKGISI